MSTKRDYKAEYRRRIERGKARGLSRSQARGHPKANERGIEPVRTRSDPGLEAAIRSMNHGRSMTAAARSQHISIERLRRFLVQDKLGKRVDGRWITSDRRPRRVPVLTAGRIREPIVDGFEQAQLAGEHWHFAGQFVRTNDISLLKPFEGRFVVGINGQKYALETDPNELHRIAAMDMPAFQEIYELVSVD